MKKGYIILFIVLILLSIGLGFYIYNSKNSEKSNNFSYNGVRVSANNEFTNSSVQNQKNENQATEEKNTTEINGDVQQSSETNQEQKNEEHETQIADFTTKIYTKDSERQNNISITCSSLNDTTVDNGQTFSFCNTVGKATTSKGYEEADVYKDGEVIKALGGGNCQVSTTLYNAVLKVDNINVTERHEHSNSVPYVEKGKDAAVAYGSYDLKFVNNTGNKIKISASCDNDYVYVKIFKIS